MNMPAGASPNLAASGVGRCVARWGRAWAWLGLVWALALSTLACQPAPPAEPWRIAISPWLGYEPLVLAQETDTLPPAMRVVELTSNTESQRAFRNGLVELAALTLDESLRLADEGVALHIVAVLSDSAGADAVLAPPDVAARLAVARSPNQATDRPPLRIGLERTALGEFLLAHWLDKQGLALADVQPTHLDAAEHENALTARTVDVLITFEPMKTRLERRGAVSVFDTRELPGAVVDVLVARPGLDPARLAALLLAWDGARQRLSNSAAPPWMALALDLSAGDYQQALQGLRFLSLADMQQRLQPEPGHTGSDTAALARSGQAISANLQTWTLIRQAPDWPRLINPKPLALALQSPWQGASVGATEAPKGPP
jgi:NitT/TauT family transport system substrate-binding protein